jgi:hypothetical protein
MRKLVLQYHIELEWLVPHSVAASTHKKQPFFAELAERVLEVDSHHRVSQVYESEHVFDDGMS